MEPHGIGRILIFRIVLNKHRFPMESANSNIY